MHSRIDLLKPTFVLRDDRVMIAEEPLANAPAAFESRTEFEATATHVHVLDVSPELDVPWLDDPEAEGVVPDYAHPLFEEAWAQAKRAASAWAATIAQRFPARRFRVYAIKYRDPVVRLHTVWPGEEPWLSDSQLAEAIADDEAFVIETPPTGTL